MTSYSADGIQVLTSVEAVRKRPGMYIGNTGPRGLHHLVYEVANNSINEALAGYCTHIEVDINADGSVTVTDDARGIPTDINPQTGQSFLETVMTCLYIDGKCGSGGYKVSGGLHGIVLLAVVNALSEWLEVTVWRDWQVYTQRYERGIKVAELTAKPSQENRTGTSVTLKPDPEIFKTGVEFDFTTLASRLQELAYLNAGLKITLSDRRLDFDGSELRVEIYHYQEGIREYVARINRGKQLLHEEIIYGQEECDRVRVEVAFQWRADDDQVHLLSFANQVRTIDDGTHVAGMKAALINTTKALARKQSKIQSDRPHLSWKHLQDGLTCIISVNLPDPDYEGATLTKLANPEVRKIVYSLVKKVFSEYLEFRPGLAETILGRGQTRHDRPHPQI
jgi:DNA gyrase subunit B